MKNEKLGILKYNKFLSLKIWEHKKLFFSWCCVALVQTAYNIAYPLVYQPIIDSIKNEDAFSKIVFYLAILLVSYVLYTIFSAIGQFVISKMTGLVIENIRKGLYEKIKKVDLNYFKDQSPDSIIANFNFNILQTERTLVLGIPIFWQNLCEMLIGLIVLFKLNTVLSIIYLVTVPFILFVSYAFTNAIDSANNDKFKKETHLMKSIREYVFLNKIIYLYQVSPFMDNEIFSKLENVKNNTVKYFFLSGIVYKLFSLISQFSLVLILAVGALMSAKGYITAGTLVAFLGLMRSSLSSLKSTIDVYAIFVQGAAVFRDVLNFMNENEMLTLKQSDISESQKFEQDGLNKEIVLSNIVLKSDDQKNAMELPELKLQAHKRIFLVGNAESGKSNLMKMITKLLRPNQGEIKLDGLDINNIEPHVLYNKISCVFQYPDLFDTSIRDNIRMGKLDATNEEIHAAAKKANIHTEILSLTDGYETQVGLLGFKISMGLRIRIAIARALIRNPSILIFEEVTSRLDAETEAEIEHELNMLSHDVTIITVTNKLKQAVNADEIIVFNENKIIEKGTHVQLIEKQGYYYTLWNKQHGLSVGTNGQPQITLEWLNNAPAFANLSEKVKNIIVTRFSVEHMLPDKLVFAEGDYGDTFFIVVRGKVEVVLPKNDKNRNLHIFIEEGDYFGEIALLFDKPRIASVITKSHCTFFKLSKNLFLKELEQYPEIRTKLEVDALIRENEFMVFSGLKES